MPSIIRYAGPGIAVEASSQLGIRLLLLPLPPNATTTSRSDSTDEAGPSAETLLGDDEAVASWAAKELDRHPLLAIDITRFVHLDYDCGHDNCKFRPCGLVSLAMATDADGFAHVVYVHASSPPSSATADGIDGDAICSFSLRVWRPACLPRYRALPNSLDLVAVCGAPPPPSYCRPQGCPPAVRSFTSTPQPEDEGGTGAHGGGHACAAPPLPGSFLTYEGKAVEDYTTRATLVGITAVGTLQFSVVAVSCVAEKPFTVCGGVHRSPCFGVIGKAIAVVAHPDTTTLATVIIDRGHRGTGFVDADCQNAGGIQQELVVARRITSVVRHPDNVTVFGSDDGFAGIVGPASSMPLVTPTPIANLRPGEILRFAPLLPVLPDRTAIATTLGRALFARSEMPPLAIVAAGSSPTSTVSPFLISVRDPCKAKRDAAAPQLAIRGSLVVVDGGCALTTQAFASSAAFTQRAGGTTPVHPLAVWRPNGARDECGSCDDADDDGDAACCAQGDATATERPRPAQPRKQLVATQQGAAMIIASGPPLDSDDRGARPAASDIQLQAVLRAELTIRCDALLPAGCADRPVQLTVHAVSGGVRLLLCVARAAHCQPLVLGLFGSSATVGSSSCCAASVADAGVCDALSSSGRESAPVVQCVARSPDASPTIHVFALHSDGCLSRCVLYVDAATESVRVVEPLGKLSRTTTTTATAAVGTLTAIPAAPRRRHEGPDPVFVFVDEPSGRLVVVASDGTTSSFDAARGGGVAALAANSEGRVVACSWSGALTLIDTHRSTISEVVVHPDGHEPWRPDDAAHHPPHSLAVSDDGSIAFATGSAVHLFARTGSGDDSDDDDGNDRTAPLRGWRHRVVPCWRPPTQVTAVGASEFAVAGEAAFLLSTTAASPLAVRFFSAAHCCADGDVSVERVSSASGARSGDSGGAVAMALSDGTIAIGQAVPVAGGDAALDTIPLAPVALRGGGGGATPALLISSPPHHRQSSHTCLVTWARAARQAPVQSRVHLLGTALEPVAAPWAPPAEGVGAGGLVTAAAFVPPAAGGPPGAAPPAVAVAHGTRRVSLLAVQAGELAAVAHVDLPAGAASIAALIAVAPDHDGKCRLLAVSRVGGIYVIAVQAATAGHDGASYPGAPLTYALRLLSTSPPLLPTGVVIDAALRSPPPPASSGAQRAPKWARTEAPPPRAGAGQLDDRGTCPSEGGDAACLLLLTRRSDGALHVVAVRDPAAELAEHRSAGVVAEYLTNEPTSAAARFGDARRLQLLTPAPNAVHSTHWAAEARVAMRVATGTRPGGANGVLCRAAPGSPATWIDADDLVVTSLDPRPTGEVGAPAA